MTLKLKNRTYDLAKDNKFLDRLPGFKPGEMTLIGGSAGVGETTWMTLVAMNLIDKGKKILWVSRNEPDEFMRRVSKILLSSGVSFHDALIYILGTLTNNICFEDFEGYLNLKGSSGIPQDVSLIDNPDFSNIEPEDTSPISPEVTSVVTGMMNRKAFHSEESTCLNNFCCDDLILEATNVYSLCKRSDENWNMHHLKSHHEDLKKPFAVNHPFGGK